MQNRYYFLHTQSINIEEYNTYKEGLQNLVLTKEFLNESEITLKHVSIWEHDCFCKLCSDINETAGLIKFLEQCISSDIDISNDTEFNIHYPRINVGFLGIDFTDIVDIEDKRKIRCSYSLLQCKSYFLIKRIEDCNNKDELKCYLTELFSDYIFENKAIDDIYFWRINNKDILNRVLSLLDDIPKHPFIGGLGKTEVLKHESSIASKRINDSERITYSYSTSMITIYRCKTHYQY